MNSKDCFFCFALLVAGLLISLPFIITSVNSSQESGIVENHEGGFEGVGSGSGQIPGAGFVASNGPVLGNTNFPEAEQDGTENSKKYVPDAYGGYGPLEVPDLVIPANTLRNGSRMCPVGTTHVHNTVMKKGFRERCEVTVNLPDDIDQSIMNPSVSMCDDMERHANDGWVNGITLRDGSHVESIWDTKWDQMELQNSKLQWDITRTELQLLWGQDEVQRMVTTCVETYSGVESVAATAQAHESVILADVIGVAGAKPTFAGLMRVFGRMSAHGFVTPFYVTVERKNPLDHTRRLMFFQQSGLIGISPDAVQYSAGSEFETHKKDITLACRSITPSENEANACAERIVAMEKEIARVHGGSYSQDYADYISSEFKEDVFSFKDAQEMLTSALPLEEFYRGVANGLDWDEKDTEKFLVSVSGTKHWMFKPMYFKRLSKVIQSSATIEEWFMYCRVSILYDTSQLVPGKTSYSPEMEKTHAHSHEDKHHSRMKSMPMMTSRSTAEKDRHLRMLRRFKAGKPADKEDVDAEYIEHNKLPVNGIDKEWLKPWHPIRKPMWRSMSASEKSDIPAMLRHPMYLHTIHKIINSDQGVDSLRVNIEHAKYTEMCAMLAHDMLPSHFERLFVLSSVDDKTVDRVSSAMQILLEVIIDSINNSDYSQETKAAMIKKVKKVRVRIGSQDLALWNDASDIVYMRTRDKDNTSLVQLSVDVRTSTIRNNMQLAMIPAGPDGDPERSPFSMPANVANAWHNPQDMTINIPAGILAVPMFHTSYSNVSIAAKLISICAHELGHMFDLNGMMFDEYGNFRSWINEKDLAKMMERIDCVSNYYSKPTRHGYMQSGENIISEAIADTYGINWAYSTLERMMGNQKPTKKQMMDFFVMYSQLWASKKNEAMEMQRVTYDEHPVPEFRIRLNLYNLKQFANMCQREPACKLL